MDGIPLTSFPRTLLDVAAVVARHQLERAIERAETLRIFDSRSTAPATHSDTTGHATGA